MRNKMTKVESEMRRYSRLVHKAVQKSHGTKADIMLIARDHAERLVNRYPELNHNRVTLTFVRMIEDGTATPRCEDGKRQIKVRLNALLIRQMRDYASASEPCVTTEADIIAVALKEFFKKREEVF